MNYSCISKNFKNQIFRKTPCGTQKLLIENFVVSSSYYIAKRFLTGTEVSTALRPFYFLVHPDLFGKYPQEQVENEKSLKVLKNYVDTLLHDKKRPNPKEVKFFVKPRGLVKDKRLMKF